MIKVKKRQDLLKAAALGVYAPTRSLWRKYKTLFVVFFSHGLVDEGDDEIGVIAAV